MFRTRQMLEPLLEDAELFLVGAGFPQLRQRFLGEVLERGAIDLGICTQVRCRQVQGNASFALDLRKRLELRERWNIDVKHRALTSHRRAGHSLGPDYRYCPKRRPPALMAINALANPAPMRNRMQRQTRSGLGPTPAAPNPASACAPARPALPAEWRRARRSPARLQSRRKASSRES